MDSKVLMIGGGLAILAYFLFNNSSSILAPVGSSLPSANSQGNEFQCGTGLHYVNYEISSANGGGYCE